jgi:glycosyltransferase involved in cell wall biosynthesis
MAKALQIKTWLNFKKLLLDKDNPMQLTENCGIQFKLSICISTRNKGHVIGKTLETVLSQTTRDCEVVVVDGASTDETELVMTEIARQHPKVSYFRQHQNGGFDRDFDRAVELARGEYCWLLPDDDLLNPGAIGRVLDEIDKNYAVIVLNHEYIDASTCRPLDSPELKMKTNRVFAPDEVSELFESCLNILTYVGSIVIRRDIWLSRPRHELYGCDFIHLGIVFRGPIPGSILLIVAPLIRIRIGGQQWLSRGYEIAMVKWPRLVNSFLISDSAKAIATIDCAKWKSFEILFEFRAIGGYSLIEYRKYIRSRNLNRSERVIPLFCAIIPSVIANTCCILRHLLFTKKLKNSTIAFFRHNRNCFRLWRLPGSAALP